MEKINIVIVDDQNLFRQSLALLMNTVNQFNLIGEFDNANSFLQMLSSGDADVDVAVIDMDMPGMNGIELNAALHDKYPHIKVIILSVHVNPLLITQMIDARASAYLAKNCDKNELITAIQSVHKTGFYFNHDVLKALQHSANHRAQTQKNLASLPIKLTGREKQILKLICSEYSNVEIGKELYLSTRTVEGHRNNLLAKTGCKNTAGLVIFAIKHSLFELAL